jgi:hypothetical protein
MRIEGFTRAHWIGLVVPMLAALSPPVLSLIKTPIPQPLYAVLAGAIVAAVCFPLLEFVYPFKEGNALGKAVLLGALATEIMIFHASTKLPSVTTITLYLFFYFNTVEFMDSKAH